MGEQKWNGKTASMIAHDKVWAGDKWTHPSVEALISRVAAMEEALRNIAAIHVSDGHFCSACGAEGGRWPCDTSLEAKSALEGGGA